MRQRPGFLPLGGDVCWGLGRQAGPQAGTHASRQAGGAQLVDCAAAGALVWHVLSVLQMLWVPGRAAALRCGSQHTHVPSLSTLPAPCLPTQPPLPPTVRLACACARLLTCPCPPASLSPCSNYEDRNEDFIAETVLLRRRFAEDEPGSFLRPSEEKLPGHALALSMEKVWEVVREHKDLNLPAHRVMVANIRCAEIMAEQLEAFSRDQAWRALAEEAGQDLVPGFGQRAGQLIDSAMAGGLAAALPGCRAHGVSGGSSWVAGWLVWLLLLRLVSLLCGGGWGAAAPSSPLESSRSGTAFSARGSPPAC